MIDLIELLNIKGIYLFFFTNPEYYFYGIGISVSTIIFFIGSWDSDGGKKLQGVMIYRVKKIILGICFLFILFLPPFLFNYGGKLYGLEHSEYWFNVFTEGFKNSIYLIIVPPVLAIWIRIGISRFFIPWISNLKHNTRVRQSKASESDIRVESGSIKMSKIDPRTQYKNNYIYIGMTPENKPIRIKYDEWKTKHMRVIAPTTFGKGVLIGGMLDQSIRLGSLPMLVDGKPDRHALAIIRKACFDTGRKLVEIDLYNESYYCYEPFLSGTNDEVEERLWSILDLNDSGSQSDFYKRTERLHISEFLNKDWDRKVASLLSFVKNIDNLDTKASQELLSKLMSNSAVNGVNNTLDIDSLLASDTVIYIRSSLTTRYIIKLTNCLIQNIVQSTIRQDLKNIVHRPIFIDEARFFVSELLADSMATISDFGANFILTYQSYKDMQNLVDQRLNSDSIAQSINTNSLITYIGQSNAETAEVFEKETGTIIKQLVDRMKIGTNAVGGDEYEGQAFLTNKEVPLITANQFLTFPAMVGVLIKKPDIATIVRTSFIPIDPKKEYDYIKPSFKSNPKIKKTNNKTLSLDDINDSINNGDSDYSSLFDEDY